MNNDTLRELSGQINTTDSVVVFLYELMRDYLPCGTVEDLVRSAEESSLETVVFTNGWLAEYAKNLSMRLGH